MVKVAMKAVSSKYVLEIARVSEKGKKFFVVTNKKLNSTGRGKSGETPFSDFVQAFNAFGHNIDDYVLTSKNYIWVYPGKELIDNCITVLPENSNYNLKEISKSFGICTDFPIKFENILS